jgi:hypothetical protein
MNTSLREIKIAYASRETDDIHETVLLQGEEFVAGYLKYLIEYLENHLEAGEFETIELIPRE